MKIFISADIEGVTGSTVWDETERDKSDFSAFAHQMSLEVNAACEGANSAGAKEIVVKDAHDSGRNIIHNLLPRNTKLVRGWSGGIYSMVQELDSSYDALIFVGYHSAAGQIKNPLAHTMVGYLDYIKINGKLASEFLIHSYIAAYLGVPVAFLSGDLGICEEVKSINEHITTVSVKEGKGHSTINIHPELALERISQGVKESLSKDLSLGMIDLPETFKVEIRYKDHKEAFKKTNYPGIIKKDGYTLDYNSDDYMEVLKMMKFLI